jgi:hypothetical protein
MFDDRAKNNACLTLRISYYESLRESWRLVGLS